MATVSSSASNKHELSVVVSRSELSRNNNRLHWAIFIKRSDLQLGHMFHVLLINKSRLYYQFDRRDDVSVEELECSGHFKIATLDSTLYGKAISIIEKERPPSNGEDGCQEWVFNCLLEMENEDVIPHETCEWVYSLMALPIEELVSKLGTDKWVPT